MAKRVSLSFTAMIASTASQIIKEPLGFAAVLISVLGLAWPVYVEIDRQHDIAALLTLVDLEAEVAKHHDVGRLSDVFAPDATIIKWQPPDGNDASLAEERWIGIDAIRERYKGLSEFTVLGHTHVRIDGYWPCATTAWATSSTVGVMIWDKRETQISRPDADRWEFRKVRVGSWPFRQWRVRSFEYHYSQHH